MDVTRVTLGRSYAPVPEGRAARLEWPLVLRRWVPWGLALGVALVLVVGASGYGGGSVLLWQLVQIFGGILLGFALAMWVTAYLLHLAVGSHRPKERRKPMPEWAFDIPRVCAAVATVVTTAAVLLTAAFAWRIGELWSFYDS